VPPAPTQGQETRKNGACRNARYFVYFLIDCTFYSYAGIAAAANGISAIVMPGPARPVRRDSTHRSSDHGRPVVTRVIPTRRVPAHITKDVDSTRQCKKQFGGGMDESGMEPVRSVGTRMLHEMKRPDRGARHDRRRPVHCPGMKVQLPQESFPARLRPPPPRIRLDLTKAGPSGPRRGKRNVDAGEERVPGYKGDRRDGRSRGSAGGRLDCGPPGDGPVHDIGSFESRDRAAPSAWRLRDMANPFVNVVVSIAVPIGRVPPVV
jgi:hypothetical protein